MNWGTAQTVTVKAAVDEDYEDEAATLVVAASGGGYGGTSASVPVSVTDLDTPAIEVEGRTITTTGQRNRDALVVGGSRVDTDVRAEVVVSIELPEAVPDGLEIVITEVAPEVPREQAGLNFGVVVDIELQVGGQPGTAQRLCLPVPRGGGVPVLLRYGGTPPSWQVVGSQVSGGMVCASGVSEFSPFAVATRPRSGGGPPGGGLLFPPQAPTALMAAPGHRAVRLAWSPPDSDGGSAILRYEYRQKEGTGEFGGWTPIPDSAAGEVNASGYRVTGLLNGTVYAFELRAVNAAGNGRVSEPVEVTMPPDPDSWSNFRAEDLQGSQLMLEVFALDPGSRDRVLRFGEGLRFEEDELDGEGEVAATGSGSYGYRYTSRTTGVLSLDYGGGDSCEVSLTFRGEGEGGYSFRCRGASRGQGSFVLSPLNRTAEFTNAGPFEVEENRTVVGRLEAVDPDAGDEVTGYGIAGGADGALFAVDEETGELSFREAPDFENPGDVESADPRSAAGDNEYIVVVEVTSGEGERERRRQQAIRIRVTDVEMEEEGEDPSDFTGADLEGRRLTLRLTGDEGTGRRIELRFGGRQPVRAHRVVPAGSRGPLGG